MSQIVKKQDFNREGTLEIKSLGDEPIELCWQKTDRKSKSLDFYLTRNHDFSKDTADTKTLESLGADLEILENELILISRNIKKQRDVEKERFDLTVSSS